MFRNDRLPGNQQRFGRATVCAWVLDAVFCLIVVMRKSGFHASPTISLSHTTDPACFLPTSVGSTRLQCARSDFVGDFTVPQSSQSRAPPSSEREAGFQLRIIDQFRGTFWRLEANFLYRSRRTWLSIKLIKDHNQ